MSRTEYLLASALLRLLAFVFRLLPLPAGQVVLATARLAELEGNLAYIHSALRRLLPSQPIVLLLEPYGYGLRAKLAYLLRVIRGMYYLQKARLFVVDNAYLPIHVAPHPAGTTVAQVWHAVGAMKRFGVDTAVPPREPERTFLHRNYDYVVVSSEATRAPVSAALRTPVERVLALGTPRTDFFFDERAMAVASEQILARYPQIAGRRIVLYAPTFRGRGRERTATRDLDGERLRAALPGDYVLLFKGHPNLDPTLSPGAGFDVVVDPKLEINDVLTLTDILITDYSSTIFEWALLRRPLILLVADLHEYERDPGLYLNFGQEMIGTQVRHTDEVIRTILDNRFDLSGYDAFIERHMGACDGRSSERFVCHFLGAAVAGSRLS